MNVPAWRPKKANSCEGKGSLCVKVSARLGGKPAIEGLHESKRVRTSRNRTQDIDKDIGRSNVSSTLMVDQAEQDQSGMDASSRCPRALRCGSATRIAQA
jgi:hypothetical protein